MLHTYDGRRPVRPYRTYIRFPHRPHHTTPASRAAPSRTAPGDSARDRLAAIRAWFASNRSQVMYAGCRSLRKTRQSSAASPLPRPLRGCPGVWRRGSVGRNPYRYAPAYIGWRRMWRTVSRHGGRQSNRPRSGPDRRRTGNRIPPAIR